MQFDFERLDVYQRALEALVICDAIIEQLPVGKAHVRDQLDRAVMSVVLNIAEGAGEFSPNEKRRFYRMAKRSATESASILQIIGLRKHAHDEEVREARIALARVVAMLVRLIARSSA